MRVLLNFLKWAIYSECNKYCPIGSSMGNVNELQVERIHGDKGRRSVILKRKLESPKFKNAGAAPNLPNAAPKSVSVKNDFCY